MYLQTKVELFHIQRPKFASPNTLRPTRVTNVNKSNSEQQSSNEPMNRLLRKLKKIEGDILFDQYIADQQWETQRVQLEKDAAAERRAAGAPHERIPHPAEVLDGSDNEVSREAVRLGQELLEDDSDDDAAIAELFASLPVTEVDPISGKSSQVINKSDGTKVTIRDFGKSTGVTPRRVLEEACRARLDTLFHSNACVLTNL